MIHKMVVHPKMFSLFTPNVLKNGSKLFEKHKIKYFKEWKSMATGFLKNMFFVLNTKKLKEVWNKKLAFNDDSFVLCIFG